jgi:hypothetical protein
MTGAALLVISFLVMGLSTIGCRLCLPDAIGSSFRFVAVSGAVPEPAAWTMMLLGFARLGYVGYRKVRHAAVAGA